jgi:signal transduction histidine kinase
LTHYLINLYYFISNSINFLHISFITYSISLILLNLIYIKNFNFFLNLPNYFYLCLYSYSHLFNLSFINHPIFNSISLNLIIFFIILIILILFFFFIQLSLNLLHLYLYEILLNQTPKKKRKKNN